MLPPLSPEIQPGAVFSHQLTDLPAMPPPATNIEWIIPGGNNLDIQGIAMQIAPYCHGSSSMKFAGSDDYFLHLPTAKFIPDKPGLRQGVVGILCIYGQDVASVYTEKFEYGYRSQIPWIRGNISVLLEFPVCVRLAVAVDDDRSRQPLPMHVSCLFTTSRRPPLATAIAHSPTLTVNTRWPGAA